MGPTEKQREDRVRRKLAKVNRALRKDRARTYSLDHHGGYRIIDPIQNSVIEGERYELSLEQVEGFAAAWAGNLSDPRATGSDGLESDGSHKPALAFGRGN